MIGSLASLSLQNSVQFWRSQMSGEGSYDVGTCLLRTQEPSKASYGC